jgi:hypothetical protein
LPRDSHHLLPGRHPRPRDQLYNLYGQLPYGPFDVDESRFHRQLGEVQPVSDDPLQVSGDDLGLERETLSLPEEKLLSQQSQAEVLLQSSAPTFRQVMVLTGLIAAFHKAVPLLRLKGRWLQVLLNLVYFSELDLQKIVILLSQATRDLDWIRNLQMRQCQGHLWPLAPESCAQEVQTDASKMDFGIWYQGLLHNGKWDSTTTPLHINVLELTAILLFLQEILPPTSRRLSIMWRVDNTTALAYIKKEGGPVNQQLLELSEKILNLAHQRSIRLFPVYIPSEENLQADAASRFKTLPDWHLSPSVFRRICAALGTPQIDLFASKASKQTRRFFSWNALDRPEAVDALSQVWDFDLAYAQSWFPYILTLNVTLVRRLSFSADLLLDLTTGSPPPILKNLQLVVWRILGGAGNSPCPTAPLLLSRQDEECPQGTVMKGLGPLSRSSFSVPQFASITPL